MLVSCPRCAGPESEQSRRARFSAIAMNMKIVSVGARSDGTRAQNTDWRSKAVIQKLAGQFVQKASAMPPCLEEREG